MSNGDRTPPASMEQPGVERPCKLCQERIYLVEEKGKLVAVDAKSVIGAVVDSRHHRVMRWAWFWVAHETTCAARIAQRAVGGSAAPSKSAPSPSAFQKRKES